MYELEGLEPTEEDDEDRNPMMGLLVCLAFSIPFWGGVAWLIWG